MVNPQFVFKNGMSGFQGEHCATDGSVVTRVMLVRSARPVPVQRLPRLTARVHGQESRKYEAKHPFNADVKPSAAATAMSSSVEPLSWQVCVLHFLVLSLDAASPPTRRQTDDVIDSAVAAANVTADGLIGNLHSRCTEFRTFGKRAIKEAGCSPDSFVQMVRAVAAC